MWHQVILSIYADEMLDKLPMSWQTTACCVHGKSLMTHNVFCADIVKQSNVFVFDIRFVGAYDVQVWFDHENWPDQK